MKKGFYCDKDGEILLITENESNNSGVKSNNELFKQALVEGVNRHIDKTIEEAKKIEQIEKMAILMAKNVISDCALPKTCAKCRVIETCLIYEMAERLYNAGYRKQSEGEWKLEHETYGKMRCSVCGKECPTERKPDPYEDYQMTDFYVTSPFCPNCGAKMTRKEDEGK